MMMPTFLHDFFNPEAPPQQIEIRVEILGRPQFEDLMEQWPVKKVLTARDITYCQIIMPKAQVEDYILTHLLPDEQNVVVNRHDYLPITVRDLDTLSEYQLCLWENGSSSYVLTKGWGSAFVRRRELEVGEEVGFSWDQRLRLLRFAVLSRPPVPPPQDGFGLLLL